MIVVTGASGHLGRLVAEALAERVPTSEVRLGARSPEKIADLAQRGFATARVDFDDPASLDAAFAGADAVLIISGDAPNELRVEQHKAAIDAAKRAGVGRVVYTSFANPSAHSRFTFALSHRATEAYLEASGLPYTILRNAQYAENLPLATARDSGVLAMPATIGKVAYITRADLAAAAAAVLTQDGHAGWIYEVTGPEAINLVEAAEKLSKTWGREIKAVEITPEAFAEGLTARGLPPFVVEALVGIRAAVADGEYARVSPDAERLLGRKPESISEYLSRA